MKKNLPDFVKREKFTANAEYHQWLSDIKERIRRKQIKAAIHINNEFLEFYWSLGYDIVELKAEQKWGSGVIQQLSLDLKEEFPKMTGLSYTNLRYVSQWYRFYTKSEDAICQQVVGKLEMPQK